MMRKELKSSGLKQVQTNSDSTVPSGTSHEPATHPSPCLQSYLAHGPRAPGGAEPRQAPCPLPEHGPSPRCWGQVLGDTQGWR